MAVEVAKSPREPAGSPIEVPPEEDEEAQKEVPDAYVVHATDLGHAVVPLGGISRQLRETPDAHMVHATELGHAVVPLGGISRQLRETPDAYMVHATDLGRPAQVHVCAAGHVQPGRLAARLVSHLVTDPPSYLPEAGRNVHRRAPESREGPP